eukprot:Gb_40337 [translate_table: standard]
MGGDPVTTEPTILKVDEDVRSILEDEGLLAFFRKLAGFNEDITSQIVETWRDGKVVVNGLEFSINEGLIAEVSGLPNEGEVITRDKTNQVGQLTKFIRDDETFCWLDSRIARESLPKPWDRVAIQVMKYLTLEGKFCKLFGYHIAILNSMRNKEKVNIPLFLLKSMEKSVRTVKARKGKAPLHQGLMKLLVDFKKDRRGAMTGPSKGGFSRLSGTPISKAQLLLGPAPLSLMPNSGDTVLNSEDDSLSQDEDPPIAISKEGDSRKRKPPSQVPNASLAKCSRRSTRLQKKDAIKAKIVDYVESSGEDHTVSEMGIFGEWDNSPKVADVAPVVKGLAKAPDGTQTLTEELRCHLKVLNGLGGSLSSTCPCINLLTLEITNYLKEVVKNMKSLNAAKEQQDPAGK